MTLAFFDGFDRYNGTGTTVGYRARWGVSTTNGMGITTGRFGTGQAITHSTGAGRHSFFTFAGGVAIAVGFAINLSTFTPTTFFTTEDVTTGHYQNGLLVNVDGSISVTRNVSPSSYTVLATSAAGLVTQGSWFYCEVEIVCNDTTGSMNVYLNGGSTAIVSVSGVDTKNSASTANMNRIRLGGVNAGGSYILDDVYACTAATRLGECKAVLQTPTGDTAQKDFIPNSGVNNYSRVANNDSDTSYVSGSVVGDLDLYTMDAVPSTAAIHGVKGLLSARKTDAAARAGTLTYKIGATEYDHADIAFGTAHFADETAIELVSPATGVAWTKAELDAMTIGPKVTV